MRKFFNPLFVILILFLSAACSQLEIIPRKTDPVMEDRIANDKPIVNLGEDKKSLTELILGDRSESLDYGGSITFQTALDKVSFMPLASVDAASGVIITDWYTPPESPGERFKVNIYILDKALRADGLRVTVFRQRRTLGERWIEAKVNQKTGTDLENAILKRARQMRIKLGQ